MFVHTSANNDMIHLFYSPEAMQDLTDIQKYIENELCNPSAAVHVIEDLLDSLDKLKEFPDMEANLSYETGIKNDYQFITSENYMAFYRHKNDKIFIDRILYKQRNYLRILFDK